MKLAISNIRSHINLLLTSLGLMMLVLLPAHPSGQTLITTHSSLSANSPSGSGEPSNIKAKRASAASLIRQKIIASAGPSTIAQQGTEVFLQGRVRLVTSFIIVSTKRDITPDRVTWEFLPDKGHVATLTDSSTLSPHFTAEKTGIYALRMSGEATFTTIAGSERTVPFEATVTITVAETITDFRVCRVEINQGIQTMDEGERDLCQGAVEKDNGIELVKGRSTLVRVYVGMSGVPDALVSGVTGQLRVFRNGVEVLPAPELLTSGQRIEVQAPGPNADTRLNAFRASLPSSLNFLLNKNHTSGTIELRAEINLRCTIKELDCSNNERSFFATFQNTRRLNLNWLTIRYKRGGLDLRITDQNLKAAGYLKKTYPLADDGICVAYHGPDLEVGYALDTDGSSPVICDFTPFNWICDDGWTRLLDDIGYSPGT